MKSVPSGLGANIKCRGKLTMDLPCRCCVAQNFKWSERIKQAQKEIQEFAKTGDDDIR